MQSYATRIALVVGAVFLLGACDGDYFCSPSHDVVGSGYVVTEPRPVHGFDAVLLSGVGVLVIEQTGVEALTITAEDNILPFIDSEVRNGRLVLGPLPQSNVSPSRQIEYRLSVVELEDIEISGVTEVAIHELDTRFLHVSMSGVSSLTASGWAARQNVEVSGTSLYRAGRLDSEVVEFGISGASTAVVRASELLEGTASGASVVEYFGRPVLRVSVSGSSVVRWIGE